MEMLRADDEIFIRFGQVYMTTAYPGAVKAWHYHKKQVDNFVVVKGMMKVVLYDGREASPTFREINEFFMGEHNPMLLQIPVLRLPWVQVYQRGRSHRDQLPDRSVHIKTPMSTGCPPMEARFPTIGRGRMDDENVSWGWREL